MSLYSTSNTGVQVETIIYLSHEKRQLSKYHHHSSLIAFYNAYVLIYKTYVLIGAFSPQIRMLIGYFKLEW